MLKNRVVSAFAVALLLGATACGDDAAEEPEIVEEPVVAPVDAPVEPVPAVTENAIIMDTSVVADETAPVDTAM
jgi:hypothetical protein